MTFTRRQVLRHCVAGLGVGLAGCVGGDDAGTEQPTTNSTPTDGGPTPSPTGTPASATGAPTETYESTPTTGPQTEDEPTPVTVQTQEGVAWRFDVAASIEAQPAVADGTAYVGGWREAQGTPTAEEDGGGPSTSLRALSLDDGSELWREDLGAPVQAQPAVVGDTVYAVRGYNGLHGHDYQIRAVSMAGETRWQHETQSLKFLPLVGADESGVVVGTHDDALGSGSERVTSLAPDGSVAWQRGWTDVRNGRLDAETAYVTAYVGTIRAFDRPDGSVRWTVERPGTFLQRPILVQDRVVTAGLSVIALDPGDGSEVWVVDESEPVDVQAADGRVFVSSIDEHVRAVAADDGRELWSLDAGNGPPAIALGDDALYVRTDGAVAAYDPETGDQFWETGINQRVGVVASGGRVYGLSQDAVTAFTATDGRELWRIALDGEPVGLVPGERDVLASADGCVYGLTN